MAIPVPGRVYTQAEMGEYCRRNVHDERRRFDLASGGDWTAHDQEDGPVLRYILPMFPTRASVVCADEDEPVFLAIALAPAKGGQDNPNSAVNQP